MQPIFVSISEPFRGAPVTRVAKPGASCADIVALAYSSNALDRAWDEALELYIGDVRVPREMWPRCRPHGGVNALVALRPRPRYTFLANIGSGLASFWSSYGSYIVSAAASAAISYGISVLTAADPDTLSFEPRFSIDDARNERRPYASWPAVLGEHRVFPPLAAQKRTRTNGEKVWLEVLLGLGLGPVEIDPDSVKIGDTPLSNFAGSSWRVKEAPADPTPDPWQYFSPDEEDGPGLINQIDDWVTRTTAADDCNSLEVELAWLEGQVRITSGGKRDGITIKLRIRYRKVGETDWREFGTGTASGPGAVAAEGTLLELTEKTELPFRRTFTRTLLESAQYEIGVKRVEPDYDNPNIRTKFAWSKIRTTTNEPPILDANLSLLAVTVEAGPQVDGVIDQINCVIRRVAPLWDAEEQEWSAPGATSNPAALCRWIATGPGMAKPYSIDDLPADLWGAWYEKCVAMDWRCDLDVRVGAGASPEELLQAVARCGRATIGRRGGKLVPILDHTQDAPTQLFTPRNSWGMRARRRLPPKTQAYRIEFNNAEKNFVLDEMTVYFPGYNENNIDLAPELLVVPGKTRAVEVYREAKRRIAEVLLRGMEYTFNCDWENFATAFGKRIAFAHWDVAVGRVSGRVTGVVLNEDETRVIAIDLDETIEQTLGESYAISWRKVNADDEEPAPGMEVQTLGVTTTPGVSNRITLAAVGGVPIADAPKAGPDGRPGDLVTFGDANIQTLDLVVGPIRRAPHYEAEITAVAYVSELYDDDDAPEPEWQSNISGDAFPPPPKPEIFGTSSTGVAMYAGFDFPANTGHRVRGIEAFMRRTDDTDPRFALVASLTSEQRLAALPAGERGKFYEVKIVAIGDGGRRTESEAATVQSIAFAAAFTGELTQPAAVVATASDGSGGDYSEAGGTFVTRIGSVILDTGEGVAYAVESVTGGLSISINESTGVYTVSGLTENKGTAVLRAIKDGVTLDLTYSIAKAREGVAGPPGDPPSGFVDTIYAPAGAGVNLRALANANGYTGDSDTEILFILDLGDIVRGAAGNPTGGIGIDTGEWPGGYTHDLTLQIDGDVEGGGGRGGNAQSSGGQGGVAINCRVPIAITGSGNIRGGGGETRSNGPGGASGGSGGTGGNYASAGGSPLPGFGPGGSLPGGAAGSAGDAIRKNGHTVSVGGGLTVTGSVVS